MKFNVTKTSDWDYLEQVEIKTLEELVQFAKDNGPCIVTSSDIVKDSIPNIEIYDDWRE